MEYLSGRTKESEDFCRNLHRRTTSSIRKKVSTRRTDDQGNAKSHSQVCTLTEESLIRKKGFYCRRSNLEDERNCQSIRKTTRAGPSKRRGEGISRKGDSAEIKSYMGKKTR